MVTVLNDFKNRRQQSVKDRFRLQDAKKSAPTSD